MSVQLLAPADIDLFEMAKLNDEINWLAKFVGRKLTENSRRLMAGGKASISFDYIDLTRSYQHLYYWRDYAEDIAAMFREQGWFVEVTEPVAKFRDEQQPVLVFSLRGVMSSEERWGAL